MWFLGSSGYLLLQGLRDVILERTEGIYFVAKCNLRTTFSVCYCCFVENFIGAKPMPGLKTKNGVMSVERRAISTFLN